MILYISLLYVIVISTGPLHPLPGWYDIVGELRLIRARTGATPCALVHPSTATYWILQSLSLRYRNGRLSESYQACPYSVTSALHS